MSELDLSVATVLEIAVAALDDDELIELIKKIDNAVGDWDFTLQLAGYFDGERAAYEADEADGGADDAADWVAP